MSKIIPLTTEIAVRSYTKKLIFEEIKKKINLLKEEAEDIPGISAEDIETVEMVSEIMKEHGTDIAIANYLMIARGEMLNLLNRVNWCLSWPV